MRRIKVLISILVTLLLIFSYLGITNQPKTASNPQVEGIQYLPSPFPSTWATVTRVVDGDTIHVLLGNKKFIIRIIGLDTPETVDPRKPVQCMGKAASDRAKELLFNKKVVLEADPTQGETDKYGRLLRYVFINGTDDYGLGAILEGYAHEYTYKDPYKYQLDYKRAQIAAKNARVGLWAEGACT